MLTDVDTEERVDGSMVEILKLRFDREFEPELWGWDLVPILKQNLVKKLELNFGQDSEFEVRSKIWKLKSSKNFDKLATSQAVNPWVRCTFVYYLFLRYKVYKCVIIQS